MKSKICPNLYIKTDEKEHIALISLYVHDLTIIGSASKLIEEVKRQLSRVFEIKDLGELYYCLCLEVFKEYGNTLITQSKYTKGLLRRFNMNESKIVSIALEHKAKLYNDEEKKRWKIACINNWR